MPAFGANARLGGHSLRLRFETSIGFLETIAGKILEAMIPTQMRIARNTEFGPPSTVRVVSIPVPHPGKGEILIRGGACTVSAADWRLRSKAVPRGFGLIMGMLFGFRRPRYRALGTDIAGEVVAMGVGATGFSVGDRIVANLGMKLGGHAEYVVVHQKSPMARIPPSLTYPEAASLVFGGSTALAFLKHKLKLKQGERLLVIGAGGAVGSAAVQLGREFGAQVTAVCSAKKASLVEGLGANRVLPYEHSDWRGESGDYDVILDTVGGVTFENAQHKLADSGRIGLVVADLPLTLASAWKSLFHRKKALAGPIAETAADLQYLVSLCEKGRFKPVIGGVFRLEQIVQAHEIVDTGHKTGSIVISLSAT